MTTVWEFRKIGVVILLVSEMKRSLDNFAKIFLDLNSRMNLLIGLNSLTEKQF